MTTEKVQSAYDQMEYQTVEPTNNLELPTSTPANFDYTDEGGVSSAEQVRTALDQSLTLIDTSTSEAHDGHFRLSSKLFVSQTNEFLHIKAASTGVSLFPKDEHYSKKSIAIVLDALESELGVDLVLRSGDEQQER